MTEVFLKGLFWGSFFFFSWPLTIFLGIILGLFFRYWGVIMLFFLIDILFLSENHSVFMPDLPLTITALAIIFLGMFFEKYIWIGKEPYSNSY
ncbi:MAG: hypothetical protein AAB513_02705 [Patescibacteria group bacterium]